VVASRADEPVRVILPTGDEHAVELAPRSATIL
jgi:hypothetical protein